MPLPLANAIANTVIPNEAQWRTQYHNQYVILEGAQRISGISSPPVRHS
jgi:hypothetical protein